MGNLGSASRWRRGGTKTLDLDVAGGQPPLVTPWSASPPFSDTDGQIQLGSSRPLFLVHPREPAPAFDSGGLGVVSGFHPVAQHLP